MKTDRDTQSVRLEKVMRTLWWHFAKPGKKPIPIEIDEEEFEIIKLMVLDYKADDPADYGRIMYVVNDLVLQGYDKERANELVILARKDLRKS